MGGKDALILVGGGGHCTSCIDVIETEKRFTVAGIVDVKNKLHQKVLGYDIIATDEELASLAQEYHYFLVTIGQIGPSDKRIAMFELLQTHGAIFPIIISPYAYISQHAKIHEGTIVMHNAFVNAGAHIGRNCIINSGAIIEHDAHIGDYCHISTGSVINGACRIGHNTFVGSQSVVNHTLQIPHETIIGAGTVVVTSIHEPGTYVGNPGRKIR